ncbi:MAG: Lrp/AsnC ligand binding domain-containing protein [Myxococcota bacterium]|nr:Lrp/AsnC ligand binding domain-containing protein [Myxococcota bacterium]
MTGAYVLINCAAGTTGRVVRALRRLGVKEVRAVTGPFDVVAYVEAKNPNRLGDTVVSRIQTIDGVQRTLTMVAVRL